jgi:hypothetical protein
MCVPAAAPGNQLRRRAGGRRSVEDLIVEAYDLRRQRPQPFVSIMAEAPAISLPAVGPDIAHWKLG